MGYSYFEEDELRRLVEEDDEKSFQLRFERLKFLMNVATKDMVPFPGMLVLRLFDNAKRCWYDGIFLPTIAISRLAFEALLNHFYLRVYQDDNETLAKPEALSFQDLLGWATREKYLDAEEAGRIQELDLLYQHYIRPKDIESESAQEMKIRGINSKELPDLISRDVEEEAKEAILTLIDILPDVCMRNMAR